MWGRLDSQTYAAAHFVVVHNVVLAVSHGGDATRSVSRIQNLNEEKGACKRAEYSHNSTNAENLCCARECAFTISSEKQNGLPRSLVETWRRLFSDVLVLRLLEKSSLV